MPKKPHRETPVERIFREVTGRKMPPSVRRILLPRPTAKRKAALDSSCTATQITAERRIFQQLSPLRSQPRFNE